ncbi:hypothetical protein Vretifemale_7240, partial [Volvox reticuliferus]
LEQQPRVPADGMLHLSAMQFKSRYLDSTRRAVSAAREEVLRLLPDGLADRVRDAVEAAAAQQARTASVAPAPGHGRWAMVVPVVHVRVEPLYREPQDIPEFHVNIERHEAVRDAVGRYLRQRRQLIAAKYNALVEQYANNMNAYKQYMQTDGRRPPAPLPPPTSTGRGSAAASAYGAYGMSRAVNAYNPYAHSHSDVVRSDLDEHRLINNFLAVEQLKQMCALPDMVLDPWERRWRAYDNRNGLVQDPVRELEEERMIKSWAEEERTLFMDKFLQHPKDFRKISTYLPGRSPGDCVAFFYKNQKLDDFSTVRRKQQLKKRRLQADMRKQQYAPLLMAPMIARQRAMGPGAGDVGVRGVRGRASTRGGPPGRGRNCNTLDADPSLGIGPMGYGGGGLSISRSMPSSGMPGYQSMYAAAQRAAAAMMALEPRDPISAPHLPPISSNVVAAAAAQAQAQAQAALSPPQQQQQHGSAVPAGSSGAAWTDEDFVECYRQHGKCWEAYCRVLGIRTESAVKQYYYRNKERLGLDRLATCGGSAVGGNAATAVAASAGGGGGGAIGVDAPSGLTAIATTSAAGPSRKAYLAARLANEESAAPGLLAAATAAAAMANAAAAAAAAAAANAPTPVTPTAIEDLGTGRAVPGASPLRTDDAAVAGLGLLAAVSGREPKVQYHSPSPPPPVHTVEDVSPTQAQVQTQVPVQVLEQARAQAQAEAQAAAAQAQAQAHQVLEHVRVQAVSSELPTQTEAGQPPALLIPRHPSGRRRVPARIPAGAASLPNGPHSSVPSLESNEVLRHEGRYKQELDADMRSDSEYEPPSTGGGCGTGGPGNIDGLPSHLDFLAALRSPVGNPLSQLLAGGLLPPGTGAATAGGGTGAAAGGVMGGKGAAGGANAAGGGTSGSQLGVLGQLLQQQQQQQQRDHREQQQSREREREREIREQPTREQTGSLSALTAVGLNFGMLGGLAGVLPSGMSSAGAGGSTTISLFTGQPTGSQAEDPSGGQLPSPGDDGPLGTGSGGGAGLGAGGRRSGNYWSDEERKTFLQIFQMHGRDWTRLADAIPTKSTNQIKTFYHNYKTKLGLDRIEHPAIAAQPASRRGQGARAIRDAAAAANAATVAAVTGGNSRAFDDVYGDEDQPRPIKRQAGGPGHSQGGGLELGSLSGDVSPQRADTSGGASPVLPPVMDLQALAHAYGASSGAQVAQHLFTRDRDHDLGPLAGTGPAGGGSVNAPASTAALLQLLTSLSELQAGPSSGGPSGGQALGVRDNDESLPLGRGSFGALGGPMQLHALHLPTVGARGGGSSAPSLFSSAGQAPQQQHHQQQNVPVKVQALNLENLLGLMDRERERDWDQRDRERERERDRGPSGGSGHMLQDVGLSALSALQLQALSGALMERSERTLRDRDRDREPLVQSTTSVPPQLPSRGVAQQEAPLSSEGLSAAVSELISNILQQNPHQQQSQ